MLIIVFLLLVKYALHERSEKKRLARNYIVLTDKKEKETRALELKASEMRQMLKNDIALRNAIIDSLKLKVKHLEGVTVSSSKTKVEVRTILRDTTIYVNDTIVVYKTFEWEDFPWVKTSGKVFEDSIKLKVEANDTIYVVNYWQKEGRFLPKIFGRKKPYSDVTNRNPYITIEVVQSVKKDK